MHLLVKMGMDSETFKTNKEAVLKDFTEFETYVYGIIPE